MFVAVHHQLYAIRVSCDDLGDPDTVLGVSGIPFGQQAGCGTWCVTTMNRTLLSTLAMLCSSSFANPVANARRPQHRTIPNIQIS